MTTELPPAGWYPDPNGGPGQMYWDGRRWDTEISATPPPGQSGIPSPPGDQGPRRGPTPAVIALIVVIAAVGVVALVVVISQVLKNHHTGTASRPSSTVLPVTTTPTTPTTGTTPTTAPPTPDHYIKTETTSSGFSDTNDWYLTSCGDGCAEVSTSSGGQPFGRAELVNGQWTMTAAADSVCSDGTKVPNADSDYFTWDPNTLMGTDHVTTRVPACSNPAGYEYTTTLQLRKTP
jgi:Protein of unknown function (DUF2510)